MKMEEQVVRTNSQNSITSEAKKSKRSSVFNSLKRYSSVQKWVNASESVGLCKDCYKALYESFPNITWLTNHGPFEEMERRSEEDSCSVCTLIVQTLKQNEPLYESLNKTHTVRIMHLSRLLFKLTTIAGGAFNELKVTVNNVEVCQLLVACSEEAKKALRSTWPIQSKTKGHGTNDSPTFEQTGVIKELGDLDDAQDVEDMDPAANDYIDNDSVVDSGIGDDDDVAFAIDEPFEELTKEVMPESSAEPIQDVVQEPVAVPESAPIAKASTEPAKPSRRQQWRKTFSAMRPMRHNSTPNPIDHAAVESQTNTETPDDPELSEFLQSQADGVGNGTEQVPRKSMWSRTQQAQKFLRAKRWRTELANSTPYTSGWFESIKDRRQLNFHSVKFWIDNCQHRHPGENQNDHNEPLDIILIDVENERLVQADINHRYLALSYEWGPDPRTGSLHLTKDNFDQYKQPGSLSHSNTKLEAAFRDAMILVEKIGEKYLWIDRLCIKKGDKAHVNKNVNNMDIIYGRSLVTIVKMTGHSASEQLPGVSLGSRGPLCNVLHTPDHTVVCRYPGLGVLASDCSYETRGWTFQERLLAPRCIIFTSVEVFFLCGAGSCRETCNGNTRLLELPHAAGMATSLTSKPGEPSKNPFEHFAQSWKNLEHEHLFVYSSGQISDSSSDFDKVQSNLLTSFKERMLPTSFANHTLRALWSGFDRVTADPELNEKYMLGFFITYRHLLRDYSRRILTKKGDALRAWSGIAVLLQRFSYDKEVICGLPTAMMDLALLWTPVGDPLGSKKQRDKRAEKGKECYPTWSWTSMTDPVDLLLSQRWCAVGEGLMERLRETKNSKTVAPRGKSDAVVQDAFRGFLQYCSKVGMAEKAGWTDQRPFESEVRWIGVQDGDKKESFITITPDEDICETNPLVQFLPPAEPDLYTPAPATEVLHFEANVVPIAKFWKVGGTILTTQTKSWYTDIEQVMKQSAGFSLFRSFYSYLIETFTNASWNEWRRIVPDSEQKDLLNNMGFVYDELKAETIMNHPRNPELVQDFSKIYIVALSRVRTFPPTTFYWQYLTKWVSRLMMPLRKFRDLGFIGEPWATKNVMIVYWDKDAPLEKDQVHHNDQDEDDDDDEEEDGEDNQDQVKGDKKRKEKKILRDRLARRICVGHVCAKYFEKAEPERQYIRMR